MSVLGPYGVGQPPALTLISKFSKVKPPPTGPIHRKVGAAFQAGSRATLRPQGRQESQGGRLLPSASISWGPGSPEPVVPCVCSQYALNLKINSYYEPPHPSKKENTYLEVDSPVTSTSTLYQGDTGFSRGPARLPHAVWPPACFLRCRENARKPSPWPRELKPKGQRAGDAG